MSVIFVERSCALLGCNPLDKEAAHIPQPSRAARFTKQTLLAIPEAHPHEALCFVARQPFHAVTVHPFKSQSHKAKARGLAQLVLRSTHLGIHGLQAQYLVSPAVVTSVVASGHLQHIEAAQPGSNVQIGPGDVDTSLKLGVAVPGDFGCEMTVHFKRAGCE